MTSIRPKQLRNVAIYNNTIFIARNCQVRSYLATKKRLERMESIRREVDHYGYLKYMMERPL